MKKRADQKNLLDSYFSFEKFGHKIKILKLLELLFCKNNFFFGIFSARKKIRQNYCR